MQVLCDIEGSPLKQFRMCLRPAKEQVQVSLFRVCSIAEKKTDYRKESDYAELSSLHYINAEQKKAMVFSYRNSSDFYLR